ncbi:MAG: Eco57I restriction-modification methylase domain-containing protein [Phycisphaeraceae bacterium]|nr:Eco57I restriction-modification methylase domain-containing protein [Phycisphaeraceae bacterium]
MNGHNPDILTCLANLSADEVFTPPKLAAAMLDLLPEDLFRRPDTTFLDPVCKSGVFLREIARRLNEGLKDQMPDTQARIDHILTRQVFGLAITELTGHIARRSVYCSKKADGKFSIATAFTRADGNIRLPRTSHTWDKSGRCAECGATKTELNRDEGREAYAYPLIHGVDPTKEFSVKFDVIVGNPPYQMNDGGFGRSASPIYHEFVQQAMKLQPRYLTMVIPARWFAGGKGLDAFRETMLKDRRLRSITDYLTASDLFPGIGLKGGVCYFLWDRDNPGPCRVSTHFKDWPVSSAIREIQETGVGIFVRFNEGLAILRKVAAAERPDANTLELPDGSRFDRLISSLRPFGLRTYFKGKTTKASGDVVVYQNGGKGYTPRGSIEVGTELIDCWKIYVGRAAPGTGNKDTYPHRVISTPFVGEPGSICSETYLCIGPFSSKAEAESALSYLYCRFTRFLILLHKPAQDTTRKVYTFVPLQKWSKEWTDKDLYKKYSLSAEEISFIEKIVRPMDDSTSGDEGSIEDDE